MTHEQLKIPFEASEMKNCSDESHGFYWKLYIDGASRNNPGLAGIGIYILKDGAVIEKQGFFIGIKTNNQAEYFALLGGLFYLKSHMCPSDMILIVSDSELLVRQIKGLYKVKDPGLKSLYDCAIQLLKMVSYDIGHVLREDNAVADALANLGIDKRIMVPDAFLTFLHDYGISL